MSSAEDRIATSRPMGPLPPRGRLFRKYVALFVAVVSVALLANGLLEIWFSYREREDALVRIQREQAEASTALPITSMASRETRSCS